MTPPDNPTPIVAFIVKDPLLGETLHKFRSAGRKLFLLTNSRWPYTERMMTYLLGGAMPCLSQSNPTDRERFLHS
jgi:hypothetical protein